MLEGVFPVSNRKIQIISSQYIFLEDSVQYKLHQLYVYKLRFMSTMLPWFLDDRI